MNVSAKKNHSKKARKHKKKTKTTTMTKKVITTNTIKEYCHVRNWEFVWDYKQKNKG